jgi:hypothetical protein
MLAPFGVQLAEQAGCEHGTEDFYVLNGSDLIRQTRRVIDTGESLGFKLMF